MSEATPWKHAAACSGRHPFGTACDIGLREAVQRASAKLTPTVCAKCDGAVSPYTGRCKECGGSETKKAAR